MEALLVQALINTGFRSRWNEYCRTSRSVLECTWWKADDGAVGQGVVSVHFEVDWDGVQNGLQVLLLFKTTGWLWGRGRSWRQKATFISHIIYQLIDSTKSQSKPASFNWLWLQKDNGCVYECYCYAVMFSLHTRWGRVLRLEQSHHALAMEASWAQQHCFGTRMLPTHNGQPVVPVAAGHFV